jgi:hypothetical protein
MNKFLRTSVIPCCLAATCLTLAVTQASANGGDLARKVSGTITKVDTRRVAVATSWGHMSVQSDALRHAKIGDEVTMWVNESNVVIDAYPKGLARPVHHQVRGTLADASPEKNAIKLWTPEGEKKFTVKKNRPKFTMFQDGTPITLQLDENGEVIDVHRQVELQAIAPAPQPGFRIKLEGVVARIKSGQVFVKTPGAEYSLNAKTVLQDVKVGDELTIWVSDNNVAVDHHAKGKAGGAHRYIMGELTSASGDFKEITLMTLLGTRSFTVQHGESTLSGMKEGTSVRVELNEAGHVIEIRKVG